MQRSGKAIGPTKRITVIVRAADEVAARCGRSHSELIRDALEWHLRVQALPVEGPTPEERAALAAGQTQHGRASS